MLKVILLSLATVVAILGVQKLIDHEVKKRWPDERP